MLLRASCLFLRPALYFRRIGLYSRRGLGLNAPPSFLSVPTADPFDTPPLGVAGQAADDRPPHPSHHLTAVSGHPSAVLANAPPSLLSIPTIEAGVGP